MKITVIAVGKMRDRCLKELSTEYQGRLKHYLPLAEREVAKASSGDAEQVMAQEARRLINQTPDGALTVALTEEGTMLSSPQVAEKFEQWMVEGRQEVVFYIGGAFGLDAELKKSCHQRWSLSKMTFPHDMARVFLWEQLYRAMTIIRGEPYHK